MADVINLEGLESLPKEVSDKITHTFNEAVESKVKDAEEDTQQYIQALHNSYSKKIQALKESYEKGSISDRISISRDKMKYKKALLEAKHSANMKYRKELMRFNKLEEDYKSQIEDLKKQADMKYQRLEESLNEIYKKKYERYADIKIRRTLKENEEVKLETEDANKVAKLLELFEEMLSIFGKTIVDVVENGVEAQEETEKLQESYRKVVKDNIVLSVALEKGVTNLSGFKRVTKDIRFKNSAEYRENIEILAENFVNNGQKTSDRQFERSRSLKDNFSKTITESNDDITYGEYI